MALCQVSSLCSSQHALLGVGSNVLLFDTTHSIAENGWERGARAPANAWCVPGDLYILPESSLQFWEINIIT